MQSCDLAKVIKNQQKEIEKQEEQIKKLSNIKLYACDENKNKECNKKHCYINGGECDRTTDMTKVKYINLDNYIHKDKIRDKQKELENLQENQYIHLDYTKKILNELLEE